MAIRFDELREVFSRAQDIFQEDQYPQIAQQLQQLQYKENVGHVVAGFAAIMIQVATLPENMDLFNRWFDEVESESTILTPDLVLRLAAELFYQTSARELEDLLLIFSKTTSNQLKFCRLAIFAHLYSVDPDLIAAKLAKLLASSASADQQEAEDILLHFLISKQELARQFGRKQIDELMATQSILALRILLRAQQNEYIATVPLSFKLKIKKQLLRHVKAWLRADPLEVEQALRQLIDSHDREVMSGIAVLAHQLGKSPRKSLRAFKQQILQMFFEAQQAEGASRILYDDIQRKEGRQHGLFLLAFAATTPVLFVGAAVTSSWAIALLLGFGWMYTVPILLVYRYYKILPNMQERLHSEDETLKEALILATVESLVCDLSRYKMRGYLGSRIVRYACSKDLAERCFAARVICEVADTQHAEIFSLSVIKNMAKSSKKNKRKNAGIIMAQLLREVKEDRVKRQLVEDCRVYKIEAIETAILQLLGARETPIVDAIYMSWSDNISQRQELLVRLQAYDYDEVRSWVQTKEQLLAEAKILPARDFSEAALGARHSSSWTEMTSHLECVVPDYCTATSVQTASDGNYVVLLREVNSFISEGKCDQAESKLHTMLISEDLPKKREIAQLTICEGLLVSVEDKDVNIAVHVLTQVMREQNPGLSQWARSQLTNRIRGFLKQGRFELCEHIVLELIATEDGLVVPSLIELAGFLMRSRHQTKKDLAKRIILELAQRDISYQATGRFLLIQIKKYMKKFNAISFFFMFFPITIFGAGLGFIPVVLIVQLFLVQLFPILSSLGVFVILLTFITSVFVSYYVASELVGKIFNLSAYIKDIIRLPQLDGLSTQELRQSLENPELKIKEHLRLRQLLILVVYRIVNFSLHRPGSGIDEHSFIGVLMQRYAYSRNRFEADFGVTVIMECMFGDVKIGRAHV